jgi:hypothetical protein
MIRQMKRVVRAPYVYVGAFLDRWYEEMPWRKRVDTGRRGEQVATRHLKRCGYIILARNYRAAGAEIDIIALDDSTLVFVEVKFRSGSGYGTPRKRWTRRSASVFGAQRGPSLSGAEFPIYRRDSTWWR